MILSGCTNRQEQIVQRPDPIEIPVYIYVSVPEELTESHKLLPAYNGMTYEELEKIALHCASEVTQCNMDKEKISELKAEDDGPDS